MVKCTKCGHTEWLWVMVDNYLVETDGSPTVTTLTANTDYFRCRYCNRKSNLAQTDQLAIAVVMATKKKPD